MRNYMGERRAQRRADLIELLGGACQRCGTVEDLEIDHVYPEEKSFTMSGAALDRAWAKLLEEARKCQVLCASHHLEKTRIEGTTAEHGTPHMYLYHRCRCDPCSAAYSIERRAYPSRQPRALLTFIPS
jgi:5-methylcytosine-specific restriction endonuclease McrA